MAPNEWLMNLRMSDEYLKEQGITFKYLSCCPTEENFMQKLFWIVKGGRIIQICVLPQCKKSFSDIS